MRGGARQRAGRPAKPETEKRVPLVISVSQETREWMRTQAAEQGVSMGVILDILIDSFEEACGE